jgi:hypothetical protein
MARVIAVERGHDGRVLREAGEQFDVPDERLKDGSNWFVPVDKAPPPKPPTKNPRPPGAGPLKGSAAQQAEPPPADADKSEF